MATIIDYNKIADTINTLKQPGELFEIRILTKGKKQAASGYFKDAETAIKALDSFRSSIGVNSNIYITLNQINEGCYSRLQKDHFETYPDSTTSDRDIISYKWLFIDFDPVRPANTSASDEELNAAHELAGTVYSFLKSYSWPEPIAAMSGNGYHFLYKIDLPNTEENKNLISNCLKALDMFFSNDVVKIDTANYNPARISKLYGTIARKGADTKERKHRISEITFKPEKLSNVSRNQLVNFASLLPEESAPEWSSYTSKDSAAFDIDSFISKYGLRVKNEKTWNGNRMIRLSECVFDSNHTNGDACIIQYASGAVCYKCFHDSCRDKRWQDVRLKYEPSAYDKTKKAEKVRAGNETAPDPRQEESEKVLKNENIFERLKIYTVSELTEKDRMPPEFIIEGMIPVGLTFLSGAPKIRKSFMALQIAAAVATGEPFLSHETKKCSVCYFDLEGSKNRISARTSRMSNPIPDNVYITNRCTDKLADNALIETIKELHKQRPDIRLFIIDTYSRSRGNVKASSANAYDMDVQLLEPIQQMAIDENIALLFVHHDRKGAGAATDSLERLSGTMGISGSCDSVLNLVTEGQRFEGKANLECNPRDARGAVMQLEFDEFSLEWRETERQTFDPMKNSILRFCINEASDLKTKSSVFYDYPSVYRAANGICVESPGDEIRKIVKEHQTELINQYGVAVQIGARSHGNRGIRILNIN